MAGNRQLFSKQWVIPSEFGQEKMIMDAVTRTIAAVNPSSNRLDDMRTALSEACLNAMEHGNKMDKSLPVRIVMQVLPERIVFRLFDQGCGFEVLHGHDTGAKWAEADPRGWGLHLISNLSDEVRCGWEQDSFYLEIHFRRE